MQKLLEAGLAEFDERGFTGVRVDDVVRRAKTSHGTFYLYFANKDDLFKALLSDALVDMAALVDEFPVVTQNDAGRAALRRWVGAFCDTYAAHASVIRILSQAEVVGEEVFGDGLQVMFKLSEAITQGMTAAARTNGTEAAGRARGADRAGPADDGGTGQLPAHGRGPAAPGRDGGPADRDHLRGLPLLLMCPG